MRNRRRIRTPFRLQFQTTECGIGVLAIMLAHFGRDVPLEEIRRVAGVSRDALNAGDIARTARHFGLEVRALRREPRDLPALGFPLIVHTRFIHFMVMEGMTDRQILLNDPHAGRMEIPVEQFFEDFTGVVLAFRPGPGFLREAAPPKTLHILAAIRPFAVGALFSALVALSVCLLAKALAAGLTGIAALAAAAIALLTGAGAIHSSARIERTARKGARTLARHILAMPQTFFSYRHPDRLYDCFSDQDRIAALSDGEVVPALSALAGLPFLLIGAALIRPDFALALALLMVAYLVSVILLHRWAEGDGRQYRSHWDEEESGLAAACETPERMKVAAGDAELFASEMSKKARMTRLRQSYGFPAGLALAAPRLFEWAAILALMGMRRSADGDIGAVLALGTITIAAGRFLRPFAAIPDRREELLRRRFHVDDVMACAPAPTPAAEPIIDGEARLRLCSVSFGYAPLKAPLLSESSLELRPGEQLGIAGASGAGKSTLAGLLCGLFLPWSGHVELDGIPLERIAPADRARLIGWVGKRSFFFEGSVRDNLCLWDPNIDALELRAAIEDACMAEVLAQRPGGLDGPVMARGRNFSGGQRQRLEIARAILRKPKILILDEAMDGLDPALETALRTNLRRRGCSLVVIAHRRSTLAACDRVLVLRNGRLVEGSDLAPDQELPNVAVLPRAPPLVTTCGEPGPFPETALDAAHFLAASGQDGFGERAQRFGIPVRPVRILVAGWWRRLQGTLVVFDRVDGRPMVIHAEGGRPVMLDPADGSERPLDDAQISRLEADGWQIYSPGRQTVKAPIGDILMASLALAVLAAALSLAAARPFETAPPPTMLAAILIAAMLFEGWRAAGLVRAEAFFGRAILSGLLFRLPSISATALRRLVPEEIAAALHGMTRRLDRLQGATALGLFDATLIPAGLLVIAWLNGRLALAILALCMLAIAVPALASLAVRNIEQRQFLIRSANRQFLLSLLWNFPRLRLLDRAAEALQRWSSRHDAQLADERRVRRAEAISQAAGTLALWLGLVVAAEWDGLASLSPAAMLAAWLSLAAASEFGRAIGSFLRARPFVGRLDRLKQAPREPSGERRAEVSQGIALNGVGYRYPGESRSVLAGIDLLLEPGRISALAGPSGGGKSTLLRLLLGIDEPSAGDVKVGGIPLAEIDRRVWRRQIGVVFQDDWAPTACTIRSQIDGGSRSSLADVWQAAEAALLADDIRRLPMGIQTILQDSSFSTGQVQRLLIARQLVRRPKMLILDEATNAVPEDMQVALIANFRRLGLTCLLVTHRQSAIAAADLVHVLEDGRLTFSGPPERFFADDRRCAVLRAEA